MKGVPVIRDRMRKAEVERDALQAEVERLRADRMADLKTAVQMQVRVEQLEQALREARDYIDHSEHRAPWEPTTGCCKLETRIDQLLPDQQEGRG